MRGAFSCRRSMDHRLACRAVAIRSRFSAVPGLRVVLAFGTGVVRRIGQAEEGAARGFAGEAQGRRLGLAEQTVEVYLVVAQRAGIGGVAEPTSDARRDGKECVRARK